MVLRNPTAASMLHSHYQRGAIATLELQGSIFFLSSLKVVEEVRTVLKDEDLAPGPNRRSAAASSSSSSSSSALGGSGGLSPGFNPLLKNPSMKKYISTKLERSPRILHPLARPRSPNERTGSSEDGPDRYRMRTLSGSGAGGGGGGRNATEYSKLLDLDLAGSNTLASGNATGSTLPLDLEVELPKLLPRPKAQAPTMDPAPTSLEPAHTGRMSDARPDERGTQAVRPQFLVLDCCRVTSVDSSAVRERQLAPPPPPIFHLPSSTFLLSSSTSHLPSSTFHLPPSIFHRPPPIETCPLT